MMNMYLVEVYQKNVRIFNAVSPTIKRAYDFAKFVGQIAEVNQSYKITAQHLKVKDKTFVWDRSRADSEELTIATGNFVIIRYVKLI